MKVSIITPVYNKSRYIEETLNAISAQSFGDFECLLIDDGSTDESPDICRKHAEKDDRFRIIQVERKGVSHARNIGLKAAGGDYITFIDADDLISKDYISNLYSCICGSNSDIVIGGVKKTGTDRADQTVLPPYSGKHSFKDVIGEFAEVQLVSGIYGTCASKMFSRALLGEVCFDEKIVLAEDLDFFVWLYTDADSVYFDSNAYYYYRQNTENSSVKEDHMIDYVMQAKIWIRIKAFLEKRASFDGRNAEIVTKRIADYFFFAMYHARGTSLGIVFRELRELYIEENLILESDEFRKRAVIHYLKKNKPRAAKAVVNMFRRPGWFRK